MNFSVRFLKEVNKIKENKFHFFKGNYEFGISRVIKAMEPYDKKLGTDTWYYCKRCFVSTIENIAKHIISIRDSVINECLQFLEQCES